MYVRNHTFVRCKSSHLHYVCSGWKTVSDSDWEPLQGAQITSAVIYRNSLLKLLEPFGAFCFVGLSRSKVILAPS